MINLTDRETVLLITYTDPEEGFTGYLCIDALAHRLAAGGFRVQKGLTAKHVVALARNMTLKQRVAGLLVDGAKSGIDYDPASLGKQEAIRRFLRAIRPYLLERYSMGPDLNTTLQELDSLAKGLGVPSVKVAIARAQGLKMPDFLRRYRTLDEKVEGMTLGKVRAGHGLATAVLTVLEFLGIPPDSARVTVQGFGSLGSSTAFSLAKTGVRVVAISDEEKCLLCEKGLEVGHLFHETSAGLLPRAYSALWKCAPREEIYRIPADVMIPAAIENAVDERVAASLPVKAVVTGANFGVTVEAEKVLYQRGILVVPDFVAGCGGSLSMEGLFGPRKPPTARQVLDHVENRMRQIVSELLKRCEEEKKSPREIALRLCKETKAHDAPPYGRFIELEKKEKSYV